MDALTATHLWMEVERALNNDEPGWRTRIENFDQVRAVEGRLRGRRWTNDEVFEGFVRSVLSSSTDWAKIERVLPELHELFLGYSLSRYAAVPPEEIIDKYIPWFRARRAGSMTMRRDLTNLIHASERLLTLAEEKGSLERYFAALFEECGKDMPAMAVALGSTSSRHKLPALGIPLAAEFLKNIGYDVAKPDRHINRAAGSFGWVQFRRWPVRSGTTPPQASEAELLAVMRSMEHFAEPLKLTVTFVDNAIWLLCARSGLRFSNAQLSALVTT